MTIAATVRFTVAILVMLAALGQSKAPPLGPPATDVNDDTSALSDEDELSAKQVGERTDSRAIRNLPNLEDIRLGLAEEPSSKQTEDLKKQFRKSVEQAFDARQLKQKAELDRIRARLAQIQATMDARKKNRDQIIDHRVEELVQQAFDEDAVIVPPHRLPSLRGQVITRSIKGLAELSIGQDDGVRIGEVFVVYEDSKYLGKVVVIAANSDRSVARVTHEITNMAICNGARVTNNLDPPPTPPGSTGAPTAAHQTLQPAAVVQVGGASNTQLGPGIGPPLYAQVLVTKPAGTPISFQADGKWRSFEKLPARHMIRTGESLRFTLSQIPNHKGLVLTGSIELRCAIPETRAMLQHNAIPVSITDEDIDQATSGNLVTKVVYLPDPEFAELALAGIETLVTHRLDPGVDPVVEADRRGSILGIFRLGNRTTDPNHKLDSDGPHTLTPSQLIGAWSAATRTSNVLLRFMPEGEFYIRSRTDFPIAAVASGDGTWRIENNQVIVEYKYDGQEVAKTILTLKIEGQTKLSYEGVPYNKINATDSK